MRAALLVEPQQGLSYAEILALARAAEEAGYETLFRSDHYASLPGQASAPTTDAWSTLAGLARETSSIGLGVLVSPVTFRAPGVLAKMAITVDEMSGGRVEVGLGAGWHEAEHLEFGLPFPDVHVRFDMLEEQLAIVRGLWEEPMGWTYQGRFWQVRAADMNPRPAPRGGRTHPNLIVGGEGRPRGAQLAARYADEYNVSRGDPAEVRLALDQVREACQREGRDAGELTYSALVGTVVGQSAGDVRDRIETLVGLAAEDRAGGDAWFAQRRPRWIVGTPDQAGGQIAAYLAAGAQRIVFQDLLPRDLEMVRELAELARDVGATMFSRT